MKKSILFFVVACLFPMLTLAQAEPDNDGDGVTESYFYIDAEGKLNWENGDGDTCPTVYNPGDQQEEWGYTDKFNSTLGVWEWLPAKSTGPGLGSRHCSTDFNGDGIADGLDIAAMNDCTTIPYHTCNMPTDGKHRVGDYDLDGMLTRADFCQLVRYQFDANIDIWWTVLYYCGIISY